MSEQSRKDEARDRVWRSFVRKARADSDLEKLICRDFGLFRFMDVVDLIVDELIAWQDEQTDLPARVEVLRRRVADLEDCLGSIGEIWRAGTKETAPTDEGRLAEAARQGAECAADQQDSHADADNPTAGLGYETADMP